MKTTRPKEKNLNIRIDEHTLKLLAITSKRRDLPVSILVREYIQEGIMRDSRKRKKAV